MLSFEEALKESIKQPEMIREFNRLSGTHIGEDSRAPIVKMVDEVSGYQKVLDEKAREEFHAFANFIYEFIYLPVIMAELKELVDLRRD